METSRYRKLYSNGLRGTTNKKPKGTTIQFIGSEGGYNRSAKQEMVVVCGGLGGGGGGRAMG